MATTVVHYSPAQHVACKAQAAITAGSLVEIAGPMDGRNPVVKPATAGAAAFGVIAHDVAKDEHATVYCAGHVVDIVSSGSIAAGDEVACAAGGKCIKASSGAKVVGIAIDASGSGETVRVQLR